MNSKYRNYGILVLSCDKYSDLWMPFFSQVDKFWPKCPFPIYLGSNTKKYSGNFVKTILSVSRVDWSTDLINILKKIKEKYIFLWIDDFFPTSTIDTSLFVRCFQFMEKTNANHIHLAPGITPDGYCEDTLFGYYKKRKPYRVIASGFWNKQHLIRLLLPGENPWNFEIMGSYRSSYSDGYYTISKPLFQLIRIVDKGKIGRHAYDYCQKNGITLDTKKRQVYSYYEDIQADIASIVFEVIKKIPWEYRVNLMDTLRRIVVSY
jgi:hypothetical protein